MATYIAESSYSTREKCPLRKSRRDGKHRKKRKRRKERELLFRSRRTRINSRVIYRETDFLRKFNLEKKTEKERQRVREKYVSLRNSIVPREDDQTFIRCREGVRIVSRYINRKMFIRGSGTSWNERLLSRSTYMERTWNKNISRFSL